MRTLLWLVPVLPLAAAAINGALGLARPGLLGRRGAGVLACAAVALSGVLGFAAIGSYLASDEFAAGLGVEQTLYLWVPTGGFGGMPFDVELGFLLDPLSAIMLALVTFVGFWIHVYSVGYMADDPGVQRYFAFLNLFMGAMLLLVLGNNYLVAFVGWEGVGVGSYLLIGFYFRQEVAATAGRKAFIVNRIGDCGFLLAIFALAGTLGTLRYGEVFERLAGEPAIAARPYALGLSFAGFVALALLVGAIGKSAQIPLFVWLPDAMAGPTPVSALIHAATMVTAGVYIVVRSHLFYDLAPAIALAVAVIGTATALLAATIAIAQDDIKKVLAYSTVSQLGFMFLAAGVGAYGAAIFHLGTHAFFKAVLFLGAGSVIHALGGEQDVRRMGGLKQRLPRTYWTFLLAALAISGVPPLAGFWSKDAILEGAFAAHRYGLWAVALATAGLTACYMFRLVHLVFHGEYRGDVRHPHESPAVMTVPLVVLAFGAVAAGFGGPALLRFLAPVVERPLAGAATGAGSAHHPDTTLLVALAALATLIGLLGIWIATRAWGGGRGLAGDAALSRGLPRVHRLLAGKYWIDELYAATVVRGTRTLAAWAERFDAGPLDGWLVNGVAGRATTGLAAGSGFFDKFVVDGLVNLAGFAAHRGSRLLRRVQTGSVSHYALILAVAAVAVVCVYVLWRPPA